MKTIDIKNYSLDSGKNNQIFHHYTNVNALINIVSNQTLHFTDCMFLNDKEEYNYIFTVIDKCFPNNEVLKDALNSAIKEIDRKNNKVYHSYHNGFKLKRGRYHVLSGCLKGDSLPMWNYYANGGNIDGYSIRFNIEGIIKTFKDFDVDIYKGKVIYDFKKQVEIIEKFVEDTYNDTINIINKLDKTDDDYQREFENTWEETYGDIFEFISFIRFFLKRSAWKYEEEYRIVVLADTDDISKKFKSSKGIVKPYIEVKLEKLPIDEIKIGPNIEKEAAKAGLHELIGNKKIEIKESTLLVR